MTEYIRHGPHVHPAADHEGRRGVAQVVEAHLGQAGPPAVALEVLVEGGPAVDAAPGVREEEFGVLPRGPHGELLLGLELAVANKGRGYVLGEYDLPLLPALGRAPDLLF